MDLEADALGRRISRARKAAGLTQAALATRAHYSLSHVRKAETGAVPCSPAFVATVARVLGVTVAELYGQPYGGAELAVSQLREVAAYVDVPPELDAPPRPLTAIAAEVGHVAGLLETARHAATADRLPALLQEATVVALRDGTAEAWRALYGAQIHAQRLTRKLGYGDLSAVFIERARVSATRADDPHLLAMVAQRHTLLLLERAQWRPAMATLGHATTLVDPRRPDATEVAGSIQLRRAVIAARAGDTSAAADALGEASEIDRDASLREASCPASVDRRSHGTTFTPGNVVLHEAAVGVELRDFDAARRADRSLTPALLSSLPAERRAHHHIDMARAGLEDGDHRAAAHRILAAHTIAPELVIHHPTARHVVGMLMDRQRPIAQIRQLHRRMQH
ncbi:hypothetical protein GCM10027294_54000 [Marinactinospora endophytica]